MKKNHTNSYYTNKIKYEYVIGQGIMPISYLVYHPECWSLTLRQWDEYNNYYLYGKVYLKTESYWESIKIGDNFKWDSINCYNGEPTVSGY